MDDLFEFETSMDKSNIQKTAVLLFLLGFIDFIVFQQTNNYYMLAIILIIQLLLVGYIYGSQPSKIVLTRDEIVFICVTRNIRIPLNEIQLVRCFTEDDRRGLIRTFGAGGLFGYYGLYSSLSVPKMLCFAKRDSNWVLIESVRGNYIITPDNNSFVDQVNAMIDRQRGH